MLGADYGRDYFFINTPVQSFNISRMLKTDEQLDLSMIGQDPGQTHQWGCGKFVQYEPPGTAAGCFTANMISCFRLWHY